MNYENIDLTDPKTVLALLNETGFSFKKQFGQNFLIDPEVCPKMAETAVNDSENIIEIGPGMGVLTAQLAKRAKKVVAIEVDNSLRPILEKTVGCFENVEVVYGDCMKLDLKKLIAEKFDGPVAVCANLPYYITSPIIMMLLESGLPITSVTVMVQKEAAERLCAKVSSRESGAVTVAVSYRAVSDIIMQVPKESFMPSPKVDSTVIRLALRSTPPISVKDEKLFFKVVRAAFGQRRKTFANSVSSVAGINKAAVQKALNDCKINENIRAEALTMDEWADVVNNLYENGER